MIIFYFCQNQITHIIYTKFLYKKNIYINFDVLRFIHISIYYDRIIVLSINSQGKYS